MRFAVCVWLVASAALAQSAAPPPMLRGNLLEWDSGGKGGEFSVRTASNAVYRFAFDSKTYFEREKHRCTLDNFQKGDLVEIVSDRAAGPSLAYARTVHSVESERPRRTAMSLGRYRSLGSSADRISPIGTLTWSGVVARVNGGRIVLHTRQDGDKTILLRDDTRYVEDGLEVSATDLKTSMRVFVRGTKNFEDDLEAYQIVWGRILEP